MSSEEKTATNKINDLNLDVKTGDTVVDLALLICQGIPGPITVLSNLMNEYPDVTPAVYLKLYEKKIFGSDIWVLFKDSNRELNVFIKKVLEMD